MQTVSPNFLAALSSPWTEVKHPLTVVEFYKSGVKKAVYNLAAFHCLYSFSVLLPLEMLQKAQAGAMLAIQFEPP
jgi:hypothetical protein